MEIWKLTLAQSYLNFPDCPTGVPFVVQDAVQEPFSPPQSLSIVILTFSKKYWLVIL